MMISAKYSTIPISQLKSDSDTSPLITKRGIPTDETTPPRNDATKAPVESTYDVINNNSNGVQSRDNLDHPRDPVSDYGDFTDDDLALLEEEIVSNFSPPIDRTSSGPEKNDEILSVVSSASSSSQLIQPRNQSVSPTSAKPDNLNLRDLDSREDSHGIAKLSDVTFKECDTSEHDQNKVSVDFFRSSFPNVAVAHQSSLDSSSIPRPLPLAAMTLNLSFAGCGFLGIYHLGVAHSFVHHGHKLMMNVQKFGGASAGSLVAAALAIRGPDKAVIDECIEWYFGLATSIHRKKLGVLTPRLSLLDPLEEFMLGMFPEDSHIIAKDRLYVSVTQYRTKKNFLKTEFDSKEQLVKYLLGSSYVPHITAPKPIKIDGKKYMDGGITDNLPELPSGRTIMVTPFAGGQDICPVDKKGRGWHMSIMKQDFKVNKANVRRGIHALFPPKRKYLDLYFQRGKADAIRFLKRENFYSEDSDVVT